MKMKKTLLASAVAALAATGIQAAPLPELDSHSVGASPSGVTFKGGATINRGANYLSAIPADQAFDVEARIDVAAGDVGREGDIYQVVMVSDDNGAAWFRRSPQGFMFWDGNLANLTPFRTKQLGARETVNIRGINRQLLEAALGGVNGDLNVQVYTGYTTDSTPLTHSGAVDFTISAQAPNTCPAGTPLDVQLDDKGLCVLSGTYTDDLHLTSNFSYVLSGAVFIGGDNTNSAELTIDAGTTLYGESGNDFLVIRRGSKIHANGSPTAPIVMTSANDASATPTTRGQWGGLIINGNAPINGCSEGAALCEAQGEGSSGLFGGNDPHDNSGNLNYMLVKYAGYEITPENELNGIAFQGVGDGTNVDYVQVHNNSDDGVEFFGGTVNAKHLVLTGIGDDSVDWTMGWQGKLQHVVVVQKSDRGDQGIEADNNSGNRDSLPRSLPTISNITLIGNANTDLGMLLREGTGANISNAVVTGFGDACIDIDHDATFNNAGVSPTNLSGELTLTNSIVDCAINFEEEAGDPWRVADWFHGQTGNVAADTGMDSASYINSSAVNGLTPANPSDNFFDQTGYVGAVRDAASDWTAGWIFTD